MFYQASTNYLLHMENFIITKVLLKITLHVERWQVSLIVTKKGHSHGVNVKMWPFTTVAMPGCGGMDLRFRFILVFLSWWWWWNQQRPTTRSTCILFLFHCFFFLCGQAWGGVWWRSTRSLVVFAYNHTRKWVVQFSCYAQ